MSLKVNYLVECETSPGVWTVVYPSSVTLERSLSWNKPAKASFEFDNHRGTSRGILTVSRKIRITRNTVVEYLGKITTPESEINENSQGIRVDSVDYYRSLLASKMTGPAYMYNFLNVDPADVLRCMVGTKYILQEMFENDQRIASYSNTCTINKLLQLVRNGAVYQASGTMTSETIRNSVWSDTMGTINSLTATINGLNYGTVGLEVSRDDGTTWASVTLTWSGAYWSGTHTFSGSEATKNAFRYRLGLGAGSSNTTTPQISSVIIHLNTNSDTGLSIGTLEAYSDPDSSEDTITATFGDLSRDAGIANVWKVTAQDIYIDSNGALHALNHRGSTISKAFTVGTGIKNLRRNQQGGGVVNVLTLTGSGNISNNITLEGRASVKDDTSIATYGRIEGVYTEKNVNDMGVLNKRAFVLLRQFKDPREEITATIIDGRVRDYELGDQVTVTDGSGCTGLNTSLRIVSEVRTWSARGEDVQLEFSNVKLGIGDAISTLAGALKNATGTEQKRIDPAPVSFLDNCSNAKPAKVLFTIDGSREVLDIRLSVYSEAFRAYSTGAASGGGSTSSSTDIGHSHSFSTPNHVHNQNVSASLTGYGGDPLHRHDLPFFVTAVLGTFSSEDGGTSNGGGGSHSHSIDAHQHSQVYDIYELTYSGAPVYASARCYVNDSSYVTALPAFGIQGSPEATFEVTDLSIKSLYNPNGTSGPNVLAPGVNRLFVRPVVDATKNSRGLLRVYVGVNVTYKS